VASGGTPQGGPQQLTAEELAIIDLVEGKEGPMRFPLEWRRTADNGEEHVDGLEEVVSGEPIAAFGDQRRLGCQKWDGP
jgi:hypothetical protein